MSMVPRFHGSTVGWVALIIFGASAFSGCDEKQLNANFNASQSAELIRQNSPAPSRLPDKHAGGKDDSSSTSQGSPEMSPLPAAPGEAELFAGGGPRGQPGAKTVEKCRELLQMYHSNMEVYRTWLTGTSLEEPVRRKWLACVDALGAIGNDPPGGVLSPDCIQSPGDADRKPDSGGTFPVGTREPYSRFLKLIGDKNAWKAACDHFSDVVW